MKRQLSIVVFALSLLSVPSFGQGYYNVPPAEFFARPDVREWVQQISSGARIREDRAVIDGFKDGDNFIGFLHTNGQFFGLGETVTSRLQLENSTDSYASRGAVIVYAGLVKPGKSGVYDDKTGSVQGLDLENWGRFRGGLNGKETLTIYNGQMRSTDPTGEYQIFVLAVDAENGAVINKVFNRFFYSSTGPNGKGAFYLSSATVRGTEVVLSGKLPAGQKVQTMMAVLNSRWEVRAIEVKADGTIVMPFPRALDPGYTGPVEALDVTVCVPEMYECSTLYKAVEAKVAQ